MLGGACMVVCKCTGSVGVTDISFTVFCTAPGVKVRHQIAGIEHAKFAGEHQAGGGRGGRQRNTTTPAQVVVLKSSPILVGYQVVSMAYVSPGFNSTIGLFTSASM